MNWKELNKFASDLRYAGIESTVRCGAYNAEYEGPVFFILSIHHVDYYFYTDGYRAARGKDVYYDGWGGEPNVICDNTGKPLKEILREAGCDPPRAGDDSPQEPEVGL